MYGQLVDAVSDTIEYLSQHFVVLILNGALGITVEFFKFFIVLLLVLAVAYLIIIYLGNGEAPISPQEDRPKEKPSAEAEAARAPEVPAASTVQELQEPERRERQEEKQMEQTDNAAEHEEQARPVTNIRNDLSRVYTENLESEHENAEAASIRTKSDDEPDILIDVYDDLPEAVSSPQDKKADSENKEPQENK